MSATAALPPSAAVHDAVLRIVEVEGRELRLDCSGEKGSAAGIAVSSELEKARAAAAHAIADASNLHGGASVLLRTGYLTNAIHAARETGAACALVPTLGGDGKTTISSKLDVALQGFRKEHERAVEHLIRRTKHFETQYGLQADDATRK